MQIDPTRWSLEPLTTVGLRGADGLLELPVVCLKLSDSGEVRITHPAAGYLSRFPALMPTVQTVAQSVHDEFQADAAALSLELYRDPESGDERLTLYVRLREYKPDTMDRIDSVIERHAGLLASAEGDFFVTTDFRRAG